MIPTRLRSNLIYKTLTPRKVMLALRPIFGGKAYFSLVFSQNSFSNKYHHLITPFQTSGSPRSSYVRVCIQSPSVNLLSTFCSIHAEHSLRHEVEACPIRKCDIEVDVNNGSLSTLHWGRLSIFPPIAMRSWPRRFIFTAKMAVKSSLFYLPSSVTPLWDYQR